MKFYSIITLILTAVLTQQLTAAPRIVSLAPAVTEIVAALDMSESLVGVSDACDYPPEVVTQRSKTGPFSNPNKNSILVLNPSIIIGIGVAKSTELKELEHSGVELLLLPTPDNITGLLTCIKLIGYAIGKRQESQKLADSISLSIQHTRKTRPLHKPSVLAVLWNPPLIAAAGNTLIADVILAAGGINTLEAGSIPYPKINSEILLYRNPEMVLILDKSRQKEILNESAVSLTHAASKDRIIADIDPALLIRPGPRIAEGVRQLQEALLSFPQGM